MDRLKKINIKKNKNQILMVHGDGFHQIQIVTSGRKNLKIKFQESPNL